MRIDGPQLTSSLSLNGTTITDLNVFATTASFNSLTGSTATTGSNLFKGTQTISGSILPAVNNTYDLGSPTQQFRHVYISTGSLYIDGTKVLGSTSQELQITTDVGQSFKILETGSDSITLQSVDGNITLTNSGGGDVVLDPNTGVIQLKGPTTIYAGYKFLSSDGNAIQFGNGIAVTGSIVSTVTPLVSGSSQISYTGLSNVPSGIVSGSSQISYAGITNVPSGIVSSSSQIIYSGLTGIPSGIVSGSSQLTSSYDSRYVLSGSITQTTWDNIANKPVGIASGSSQIDITGTTGYSTFSSSISNSISSLSGSIATTTVGTKNRVDSIEAKTGSYATTGSNAFQGTQTITGSLVITQNLTVLGSSSITYITSSQLRVDDNIITLNTAGLAQRFGGIEIYDSGSASTTASLLWDSLNNKFLYQHPAGADTYASAWLMSGPVNNGALGSEVGLTTNKIVKATDDDHIGDSIMTETGGGIGISGSLSVTGSIVSTTTALVSGSNQIVYSGLTGIPSGIISGSAQLPTGVVSGSVQVDVRNTTGIGTIATTGSNQFNGNQYITGAVISTSNIQAAGYVQTSLLYNGGAIEIRSNYLPLQLNSNGATTIINDNTQITGSLRVSGSVFSNGVGLISGSSQILNGSNIWSGSAQLPSGIVSGSVQIVNLGFATTSSVITASSVRNVDTFTATANQSTFTSSQGYSVGLIDVFVNGSKLAASDYVALNGTSVLLNVAAEGGETVELYAYFQALNSNNALRTVTTATATASQTVFTGITYTQGLIEVYYNGSRLSESEYAATNGTSVTLSTAANVGDILDFIAYNYTVGAFVGLSGTGTANYLPKYASTSSLTNSSIIDNSGAVTINGTLVVTGTTLVSGSSQILNGTTIHSGSFFNGISVVSGSGQISYAGITNIPSGIVSGSAQIPSLLPSGVVSGSAQTIANLPSGTISGSVQVDVMSTTNITRLATTGSNTFQGLQTINGNLVVTGSLTAQQFIVSSSVTYMTTSFASGSTKFGDSIDDTHQFTGSLRVSGSVTLNSPLNYVASSVFPTAGTFLRASDNVLYQIAGTGGHNIVDTNLNTMIYATSSYVQINTNNSPVLVATGSNVGINLSTAYTINPLTVNGNMMFMGTSSDGVTGSTIGRIVAQTRNYGAGIAASSFASINFVTDPSTYYKGGITFSTNGVDGTSTVPTVRLSLNANGNIGMGVTTANDFLDVYGSIRSSVNSTYYTRLTYSGGVMISQYAPVAETADNFQFVINGASASTTGNAFVFKTQAGNTTPAEVFKIAKTGAATFSNTVTLTNSVFPVLNVIGTVSSPHIGSTWSVSANQDGTGRTIIGTAGQGRAMYFENNGDIVIPNNKLTLGSNLSMAGGESLTNANSTWFRRTFERNVTSWDNVVGFTPQSNPQYTYGYINITASAYNNGTSAGGVTTSRWYYSITNNSISVSVVGSDIVNGSQAPSIRLTITSGTIYVQVQSTNGVVSAYTSVFVDAMLASGYVNGTYWTIA